MNITPCLPHSHTLGIFIVNTIHQHDNNKTLQAIYCYACYLVGLLVITQELHETWQSRMLAAPAIKDHQRTE